MDDITRAHWNNLHSDDGQERYAAFMALLAITDQPVDWAYEVWDELLTNLRHPDNHRRAVAAQLLSNLARSDPQQRMLEDFDALLAVTRDERFVTARHSLQAIWKVGLAGPQQRQMVVEALAAWFRDCVTHKNTSLIRSDIVDDLRKLYECTNDDYVREIALSLIAAEDESKWRDKYARVWRVKTRA